MSLKTQIKRLEHYELQHRSSFERLGAIVLTAATLFSISNVAHAQDKREALVFGPLALNSAHENETMRHPVKLDDGLRSVATVGE